jgi:hypothetical protein
MRDFDSDSPDDERTGGAADEGSTVSSVLPGKHSATDERYLRVLHLYSSGATGKDVAREFGVSVGRAHQLRHEAIKRASKALQLPASAVGYLFYPRPRGVSWNETYQRYSAAAVSLDRVLAQRDWRASVEAICCAMYENACSDPLDDLRAFREGNLTSYEMRAIWWELPHRMRNEGDVEILLHGSFWIERYGKSREFPSRFGDRTRYQDFLRQLKRKRVTWQRISEALDSVRYVQAHISSMINSTWHELLFPSEAES